MSEASSDADSVKVVTDETINKRGRNWLFRPISVTAANYCAGFLVAGGISSIIRDLDGLSVIASQTGGFRVSATSAGLEALLLLVLAIIGTAIGGSLGLIIDYWITRKGLRLHPQEDWPTVKSKWQTEAFASSLSLGMFCVPYTLKDLLTVVLWTICTVCLGAVGFLLSMGKNPLGNCILYMVLYQFYLGWMIHTRFRKGAMKSWSIDDIGASGLSLNALSRDIRESLLRGLLVRSDSSIIIKIEFLRNFQNRRDGITFEEPKTINLWYMTTPALSQQILKDGLKEMGRIELRLNPGTSWPNRLRHGFANIELQLPIDWLVDVRLDWNPRKKILGVCGDIPPDYIVDRTKLSGNLTDGDPGGESQPEDAD